MLVGTWKNILPWLCSMFQKLSIRTCCLMTSLSSISLLILSSCFIHCWYRCVEVYNYYCVFVCFFPILPVFTFCSSFIWCICIHFYYFVLVDGLFFFFNHFMMFISESDNFLFFKVAYVISILLLLFPLIMHGFMFYIFSDLLLSTSVYCCIWIEFLVDSI